MSIEVKPGRWRTRGGGVAIVKHSIRRDPGEFAIRFVWVGFISEFAEYWDEQGLCRRYSLSLHDLVEYLGPEEPKQPLDRLNKPATLNTSACSES